ncbi:gas vesicle protein GvpG [Desulfoluna spongiiphila]|uniref:Gas vesicle protein G n=1 Tax=Desulfoluna spongiiphila TaxID=419481 RepID=A0A1G5CNJ3_9BACT|nr:gas vesicle protein GvpG [Desulfoluna spongiiphila]SCY03848.1 Gas vesicle protein G [Desulfoluna spongiiphila]VVS92305.1 gvpg gas vesicle vacuole plasmid [Desulfoluna spongiiphila]
MAFILDDILLAPVKMTVWVAEKLRDSALQEMTDEAGIYEELLHLQMQFEMDEIDEAEFERREQDVMERLDRARQLKKEMDGP